MNNEDPADPSVHERQDAYRCIAPACKPLGCSMCNCAVPADVYAELLTPLHGEIERLRDVAREAADAATKHQAEVLRLRAEVKALRELWDEAEAENDAMRAANRARLLGP